jgi:hypothetical protein
MSLHDPVAGMALVRRPGPNLTSGLMTHVDRRPLDWRSPPVSTRRTSPP